jgi:hypothetical protein
MSHIKLKIFLDIDEGLDLKRASGHNVDIDPKHLVIFGYSNIKNLFNNPFSITIIISGSSIFINYSSYTPN